MENLLISSEYKLVKIYEEFISYDTSIDKLQELINKFYLIVEDDSILKKNNNIDIINMTLKMLQKLDSAIIKHIGDKNCYSKEEQLKVINQARKINDSIINIKTILNI